MDLFKDNLPFGSGFAYESPFVDHEWSSYPLDVFSQKFFEEDLTIERSRDFNIYFGGPDDEPTGGGPANPPEERDNEKNYKIFTAQYFSYKDKNNNGKYDPDVDEYTGKYLDLKLFVSTDGAWLMEQAAKLETLADDELVVFLEVVNPHDNDATDILSDTVMLCKGGRLAAQYFNQEKLLDYYTSITTISRDTMQSLIKHSGDKDVFLDALRSVVSGFGKVVSWLPGKAGDLLMWVGEKLEALTISKDTWDKDRVTPVLKFIDEFEGTVIADLNAVISSGTVDIGYVSIPLPESLIAVLRDVAQVISSVIAAVKGFVAAAGAVLEFLFALICGIFNGIVDMIAGIFTFIGMILKLIAGGAEAATDAVANADYYVSLLLEYADNFIQYTRKIDWGLVLQTIGDWMKKIMASIDLGALWSRAQISGRELGYYIGYIGINILACFVGVGEIAAVAKLEKLAAPLRMIIDVVANAVGKLPSAARVSVEVLFNLLRSYVSVLIKGTKSVIELINTIFEAVLKWIISLTREVFILLLSTGRQITCQILPVQFIAQMLGNLFTAFVRHNLSKLAVDVGEVAGLYIVRYEKKVIYTADESTFRRYLNETLDREEADAQRYLKRVAKELSEIQDRISYMERHWIDTRKGKPYKTYELDTLAHTEVRYETEMRPSTRSEAGDAVGISGKLKGKSFDAFGTPKHAFEQDSWKYKYNRQLKLLFDAVDGHFMKIHSPEPGVPPLDKLIIDFKNYDEFDPTLRTKVMDHIKQKHGKYLGTDVLDIIN